MGWETIAMVGFNALQAGNAINQGDADAKAAAEQGTRDAKTVADNTVRKAGTLQTSFLQSGLTLEGGPSDVLAAAFKSGNTDIDRIGSNANNQSKSIVSAARTKALSSLASGFGSAFAGSSIFDASDVPESFSFGLNDAGFGQSAYGMLSRADQRNGGY